MSTIALRYPLDLARWFSEGWNRFWFTPRDPATLGLIRILAGAMLLYTHAVWTLGLTDFMGAHPWIPRASAEYIYGPDSMRWTWSMLWWCESPTALWTVHIVALVAMFCLTIGFQTRIASIISFVLCASYANRTVASQFGLDQINGMLTLYLMIGPSGACYSVDRLIARWRGGEKLLLPAPSVMANIATRLIQLHMCIIYFNAGVSKLQGGMWWDGSALWGAVANLEYQSMDLTWLCNHPYVISFMTHTTIIWEISFCALVWNRMLRPLVLLVAIPLHLGIAFGMGMITFGFVMLYGCLAFVEPSFVRGIVDRWLPGAQVLPDAETNEPETGEKGEAQRPTTAPGAGARLRRGPRADAMTTRSRATS
jgi:uncharacterized membrane protein YphA (DoxX/SURF4 family)